VAAGAVLFFVERQAGRGSLLAARAGSGPLGFGNESKKGGRFAARWMRSRRGLSPGSGLAAVVGPDRG